MTDEATAAGSDALETALYEAWPALETMAVDGWVHRSGGGFSRRLNSVTAGPSAVTADLDVRIDDARDWLTDRGLDAVFRILSHSPPEIDARLGERGLSREAETLVMSGGGPPEIRPGRTILRPRPSDDWLRAQIDWMGWDDVPGWRAVLDRIGPPASFAELHVGDQPACVGLGVVRGQWQAVFEVATVPERRRRGHATELVGDMLRWGRSTGAASAALQVVSSNRAAIALYRCLGFTDSYRYWYRR